MMVVLINTPAQFKQGRSFNDPKMPLGLLYIASFLESRGIKVEIIDAEAETLTISEIIMRLNKSKPVIIGINCLSLNKNAVISLSSKIKKYFPKSIIVVGGVHITLSGSKMLEECGSIDMAIKGEGEIPFYQLCKNLDNLDSIPGLIFRKNSSIIENENNDFRIKDLDSLPIPALHLLPLNKYFSKRRAINLIGSRGCPNNCIFCASPKVWGRKVTHRSAINIISEIALHKLNYGINQFHFLDDEFFSWQDSEFHLFCKLIRDSKVLWRAIGRLDKIDDENKIIELSESGCGKLTFGIESGSQRIQSLMGKSIDLSIAPQIIETCYKNGIKTKAYFMYGFPTESIQEMKQTLEYSILLKRSGLDEAIFLPVMPYYGTEIYNYINAIDTEKKIDLETVYVNDWNKSTATFNDKLEKYSYLPRKSINENISSKSIRKLIKYSYNCFYSKKGNHEFEIKGKKVGFECRKLT